MEGMKQLLRALPKGMRYVNAIPRQLREVRVLVQNQVVPQRVIGMNGFRAWTEPLSGDIELCNCDWAGADLHGLKHYRVKRKRG
jgi:hypothetical protein